MKITLFSLFLALILVPTDLHAQASVWTINTRDEVLKGDAKGVSVDENGVVTVAPQFSEMFRTEQPYVWSSVIDRQGNVFLGTGGEGRIFRVAANGSGSLFSDLAELNVSAMAIGPNGEFYAATSPDGKVYRLDAAGTAQIYFEPKEKYIWSLAIAKDGSLIVGTGEGGKLFRVRSASTTPEAALFFDTSETHIISLATDASGYIYAGTDSNGLVLRFGADGKPFAVLDSPLREIQEVVVAPDNSVYVLALAGSAATPAPSEAAKPETPAGNAVKTQKAAAAATPAPAKSRYDLTNAKSAIYRLTDSDGPDLLWASSSVVGFSLYAHQSLQGVMLGTSDKGRIYNIGNDGRETLIMQTDAGQISSIFSSGGSLFAASSNPGVLFRIGPNTQAQGVYESAVLDAETTAAWGDIWWRSSGATRIETRSGNTEEPNETWSDWAPVRTPSSSRGKVASPGARFLQWRGILQGSERNASLSEVSLAYRARNLAPEILSITILPANIGLLANPSPQIDPNIELSGLDPALFGIAAQPVQARRVYQRGARAFQWNAEDRNGDKLVFDVYFREVGSSEFKLLRSNLAETFYSLDGLSLADGRYVIKVVAKDSLSNPYGRSASGERISEPFDIDNTQPVVNAVGQPRAAGGRTVFVFTANDSSGYLVNAEFSLNGGEWRAILPEDGISDSPNERYTIELTDAPKGENVMTLRVFDSNGNIGNARTVFRN